MIFTTSIIAMMSNTLIAPTNLPEQASTISHNIISKQEIVEIVKETQKLNTAIDTFTILLPSLSVEAPVQIAKREKVVVANPVVDNKMASSGE